MAENRAQRRTAQIQNEDLDDETKAIEAQKAREAVVAGDIPEGGCKFVFIGDPRDARRGAMFEMDEETGEDVEPPLRLYGLKFPRKVAVLVKDEFKIRKLRGNDHFIELKNGQDLAKVLAAMPRATRERRDNVIVGKIGVASENNRKPGRLTRRERDMAEEFEGDGERG